MIQNELAGTKLVIEYPDYYEEDYQLPMLRANEIPHILRIELDGIGMTSRFLYDVSGAVSLQKKFDKEKISLSELQHFLKQFLKMAEIIPKYMLEANCVLLEPEYIFFKEGIYYFCYLPVAEVPLLEQFRKLTEFFVRQIDYSDMECIFLAHKLNQESMEEHYDIKTILEQYEREARERNCEQKRSNKENVVTALESDNKRKRTAQLHPEDRLIYEDANTVREMGGFRNQFEKMTSRIKKKRWGGWQDLILESDRQESESIL